MKTKRLITKAQEFLSRSKKKQRKEIENIKHVLLKLKLKRRLIAEKLGRQDCQKKRKTLAKELKVISMQRKKALSAIKSLKKK